MKKVIFILFLLAFASSDVLAIDPVRLRIVQTMVDSAKTQSELNHASRILSETWEEELKEKEKQMESIIPKKDLKNFKEAMKLWRSHVEKMSTLRSELFKNDMMEPTFYKMRGLEPNANALEDAKKMQPYVYNMSKSIYYEDKWTELDALLNIK